MADTTKIERVKYVSSDSSRVEKVRRATPEQRSETMREIEQAEKDRADFRAILAKYPNPDHLSFPELLEMAVNGNVQAEDPDVIVDISLNKNA